MRALELLARLIDGINERVGRAVAWLALLMVLVQVCVVILRYVFGVGFLFLQEGIVYMHGLLFMLAAGYTLLHDEHVRVDVFYREARPRTKAWIDLLGCLLLVFPVCAIILWAAWPYVGASWAVREGSRETSGIPAVYLLKTAILVFAVLVALQALSIMINSVLVLLGLRAPRQAPDAGSRAPEGT